MTSQRGVKDGGTHLIHVGEFLPGCGCFHLVGGYVARLPLAGVRQEGKRQRIADAQPRLLRQSDIRGGIAEPRIRRRIHGDDAQSRGRQQVVVPVVPGIEQSLLLPDGQRERPVQCPVQGGGRQ